MPPEVGTKIMVERRDFDALVEALGADGRTVVGPRVQDGAVVYQPVESASDLPAGVSDEQEGGRYRLVAAGDQSLFGYTVAPQGWKRWLFPPRQRLWAAERAGAGFRLVDDGGGAVPRYAFLGVRACELAAMRVQDKVFDNGDFADPGYAARRAGALVVGAVCGRSGGTCFCVSMGSGPKAADGFDLQLTELVDANRHAFLVEVGSAAGAAVVARVPHRPATADEVRAAELLAENAAAGQAKAMDPDAARLLTENREHRQWDDVARRCLTCGNCTMVCPTCFCSTVEDTTDLQGDRTERWRRWDSCFTVDFSYIHGGSVRRDASSRYRQWITHKLAHWHDQFGTSGCVGCGRCITWCPVGIDITEEVRAIRASVEGG